MFFLGHYSIDIYATNADFDLIFYRLRMTTLIPTPCSHFPQCPKSKSTIFCDMKSQVPLPLWLSPRDMAHLPGSFSSPGSFLSPAQCRQSRTQSCWPNSGKYTSIKAAIFLISNFWHLCYKLAQVILRDDQHRTCNYRPEYQDTYSLSLLVHQYNPPYLNRNRMILVAT